MGFTNRYDGIDDYAARLIRYKAKHLVGHAGFSQHELQDLEQELVLDLLKRLPNFNPQKAKLQTFIARIVEHRIATIIEEREASKRDWRSCSSSLNDAITTEDDKSCERLEIYDMDEYLRQMGRLERPAGERLDLSIDLADALARLPEDLRILCERLQDESVSDISRNTGIPRGTLYDKINRIRRLFEDAGLREYV